MIEDIDGYLKFALEREGGLTFSNVTNYDTIKQTIIKQLTELVQNPLRKEKPVIYHLDVAAMYPNIILTNRLQPSAIVQEEICAACDFNKPENNW